MVVPDMTMSWTMPASAPGEYELRGVQMCGYSHPQLMGSIIVQSREKFSRWLQESHEARD